MPSLSRRRKLRSVFHSDAPSRVDVYLAQLSVLYEDLGIELESIDSAMPSALENPTVAYRQNYFFRRSLATLSDFAEAIRLLDKCPDFALFRENFHQALLTDWQDGVAYFEGLEQHLKAVRNDIGGHFGSQAAEFAIKEMPHRAVGAIEIAEERVHGPDAKRPHLRFAFDIAVSAIFRRLQGAKDTETAMTELGGFFVEVKNAYRHACRATHVLVAALLWPRFG